MLFRSLSTDKGNKSHKLTNGATLSNNKNIFCTAKGTINQTKKQPSPNRGKYIEIERIYGSTLIAKNIHPYTELGYGFTNRLFSFGLFVGTTNGKFQGFGCRIGLELFRNW